MHTDDEILRAAAAWVWFPRGSEHENSALQLVRYPERFGGGVRASQVRAEADAATVVDHAIARTSSWGETRLRFWTNPSDSPDLEEEFRHRGAVQEDTVTVFARPVPGDPIEIPQEAAVEVVRTLAQVRDVDAVNVPVWEQGPLDDEGRRHELAEVVAALDAREGARVLARLDGRPVSTGGCTVVDGFVRLWGAATLPEYRGRGAYRAVLAERLRVGAEFGARTALVKGRVSTSAPILARAGFTRYGDERCYVLTL